VIVHVIPIGDIIVHEDGDECVCGPTADTVFGWDGTCSWVMVHHSLDAREVAE